jgi:hypothetical protein
MVQAGTAFTQEAAIRPLEALSLPAIGAGRASQSMQRNLRPPVFTSMKRIGLLHFGQDGGGVFLGM